MATCEQCGKVYEAKRADSRYCGPACKQAAHRLTVTLAVTNANRNKLDPVTAIPGYGTPDCQCKMCQGSASPAVINHGPYTTAQQLADNGYRRNRVSLPGDVDYGGLAGLRLLSVQQGAA